MLLCEREGLILETNTHHCIHREGGAHHPIASGLDEFHVLSIDIVVDDEELSNNLEASHRTIHHTLRVADSWN